ncbi:hypothetical protein V8G54_013853 [Vigna mungo]|uniref:Uncharacterized protein n=1 Tax=Vigna mungo TaxID=3915 RepID=A0AAQ3NJM9_VIGMU
MAAEEGDMQSLFGMKDRLRVMVTTQKAFHTRKEVAREKASHGKTFGNKKWLNISAEFLYIIQKCGVNDCREWWIIIHVAGYGFPSQVDSQGASLFLKDVFKRYISERIQRLKAQLSSWHQSPVFILAPKPSYHPGTKAQLSSCHQSPVIILAPKKKAQSSSWHQSPPSYHSGTKTQLSCWHRSPVIMLAPKPSYHPGTKAQFSSWHEKKRAQLSFWHQSPVIILAPKPSFHPSTEEKIFTRQNPQGCYTIYQVRLEPPLATSNALQTEANTIGRPTPLSLGRGNTEVDPKEEYQVTIFENDKLSEGEKNEEKEEEVRKREKKKRSYAKTLPHQKKYHGKEKKFKCFIEILKKLEIKVLMIDTWKHVLGVLNFMKKFSRKKRKKRISSEKQFNTY